MKLQLVRDSVSPVGCTLGKLRIVGDVVVQTIERPWLNNTKGVSCVPKGVYRLERHSSEAYPKTWALVNRELGVIHYPDAKLPNARTVVLIHAANKASELRGCIAPGILRAGDSVVRSRDAMTLLSMLVSWDDTHTLEIL